MNIKTFVSITLSDDEMFAYIELKPGIEAFQFQSSDLLALVNQAGIQQGIDMRELTELSLSPQRYIGKRMVIALGKQPVSGEDGYIIYYFERKREQDTERNQDELKVNLKEVTKLDNVKQGELLAEIVHPTEGIPGLTVKGNIVVPKMGKPARLKKGQNVVTSEDETKLYSAIDGLVSKTENGVIHVFPVYEVNGDVDYKTGNIEFNGTVIVRGNVLTGFKVTATGDIRVIGTVDGARLHAGGSIHVSEGIVGQNKGMVEAANNVQSSFIQDAYVNAGGDIIVSQSVMHSKLCAGKHISCISGNGLIVGGTIQAGEKVHARTIGNLMSTQTTIEVGVLPEIRKEYQSLQEKLTEEESNYEKTSKALTLLEQMEAAGNLDESKKKMKAKLELTKRHLDQDMERMKDRISELLQLIENSKLAAVEVDQMIYPGTKIVIGKKMKLIKDSIKRVKFYLSDGDITMSSKL